MIGIILIIIVVLTLIAIGMASSNNKKQKVLAPIIEIRDEELKPTSHSEEVKTYTDSAGFSFQYPSTVIVSPKKTTNDAIYADIEISSNEQIGDITIVVKDTTIAAIQNWMTSEGFKPPVNQIKEVTLGELNATQFTNNNKIITAVIDQKILFTITVDPQNNPEFWEKINNTIISSFAFIQTEQPTQSPQQNSSEPSGGASDETESGIEEIVE